MKAIIQHDERDCGAACLAMVAEHYGYSQSLNTYRDLTNTDQNGTSVYEIMRAAASVGLSADALSGNLGELFDSLKKNEFKAPFIAHIITEDNYSHFVVVSAMDEKRIHIYDPAKGKVTESLTDFACHWTGNIITFVKNSDFKKQRENEKGIFVFLPLLNGQFHKFIGIIILSFFISGVGIVGAFAFQFIIDHSLEMLASETEIGHKHDIEYLTNSEMLNRALERVSYYFEHLQADEIFSLFIWLIVFYAIAAIIQYIRGRLIISMTKQIDFGITMSYFNRITEMPISSVIRRKMGDYLSRYSDISLVRKAISTVIAMIIDLIMAVGCGLILYFQNTKLFFIAGAILLAYFVVVIFNKTKIKDSNRKYMERNAYVQSYMKESIDGIETLKSVNGEECAQNIMRKKFMHYIDAAVYKSHVVIAQEALVTCLETIGTAITLWSGFILVIQEQMTLGELITFYALLEYLITSVKNLTELQPVLQSGIVAGERLKDILNMSTEKTKGRSMETSKSIEGWSVSDVCFRYGIHDSLLKNVTFSFRKGDRIALIGESGSGKTTLAKLFVRFFEPESGHISIDGIDIKDYNIKSLRNAVAYVSNDKGLYSGTLYDNLSLGNPDCSDEWIQKICDIACISDLTEGFDKGKQFVIEEDGTNLSSGQKQRIMIARALLRKPKLIILDEATSNLDIHTETKILNAIENELKDITILMISHRASSIRKFDKIIVMQDGEIVGDGTNDELVGKCKFYDSLIDNK